MVCEAGIGPATPRSQGGCSSTELLAEAGQHVGFLRRFCAAVSAGLTPIFGGLALQRPRAQRPASRRPGRLAAGPGGPLRGVGQRWPPSAAAKPRPATRGGGPRPTLPGAPVRPEAARPTWRIGTAVASPSPIVRSWSTAPGSRLPTTTTTSRT